MKNFEDEVARQKNYFDTVDRFVQLTAVGANRGLIVSGPPGVGKTHGIMKRLAQLRRQKRTTYEVVKGYTKATGLYALLYKHRREGSVLVFDDSDSVFDDLTGLNILKAALDTSDRRVISWRSKAKITLPPCDAMPGDAVDKTGQVVVPNQFEFKGRIIFITNIDFQAKAKTKTKMAVHFQALLSRSQYVNIGLKTQNQKLVRVVDLVSRGMLQRECGINTQASQEAVKFMKYHLPRLRELSLRTAIKIGNIMRDYPNEWVEMSEMSVLNH